MNLRPPAPKGAGMDLSRAISRGYVDVIGWKSGRICGELLDRMLDRTRVAADHEDGFHFDHRGVTQIMSLLDLPEDVKAKLLEDDEEARGMSTREALRTARAATG